MKDVDCVGPFFVDQGVAGFGHRIFTRPGYDAWFAHARIQFEKAPRSINAILDEARTLQAILGNMDEAVDELPRSGRRPIKRLVATWHDLTGSLRPRS